MPKKPKKANHLPFSDYFKIKQDGDKTPITLKDRQAMLAKRKEEYGNEMMYRWAAQVFNKIRIRKLDITQFTTKKSIDDFMPEYTGVAQVRRRKAFYHITGIWYYDLPNE